MENPTSCIQFKGLEGVAPSVLEVITTKKYKTMNRENASKLWPIIKAYGEGKTIQMCWKGKWKDFANEDDVPFYSDGEQYRIKPEPSYRPFKDGEECWKELLLHFPYGWVKWKDDDGEVWYSAIKDISPAAVFVDCEDCEPFCRAMERYTFADGAPFGIRIKEDEDDQSEDDWEEDDGEE